jgi:uncharacterized protein YndB with AHSA1/START domain
MLPVDDRAAITRRMSAMTDTLRTSIEITATPEAIFAAVSEPQLITKYFPFTRIESEGVVGGNFDCHGEVDGVAYTHHGYILSHSAPRQFAYAYWSSSLGVPRGRANEVVIVWTVTPIAQGARLSLELSNMPTPAYAAAMETVWANLLPAMKSDLESAA